MGARGAWASSSLRRREQFAGTNAQLASVRRYVHSRRTLLLGCATGIVVLYLVGLGLSLLIARHDLLAGASAARRAQNTLTPHTLASSPHSALNQAANALQQASDDFSSAQSRLSLFAPVLRRLSWVPGVGGELAAAPAAAEVGTQTTGGAHAIVLALQPVLGSGTSSHLSAPLLLRRLSSQESRIRAACTSLELANRSRNQLSGLASSGFGSSLQTLDRKLPQLVTMCQVLQLLPTALGYPRPVTYLLGYLNPSQIRAGGGFLGSVGLVTIRAGKVSEEFTGTWLHDNLSYPPPSPIAKYEGEPAWLFRDSNWSPDFPTTAALERYFAQLDLGWRVQGVINITPQASVDALRALGSFYSPLYHRWITAGNVSQLADYYAHQATNSGPSVTDNKLLSGGHYGTDTSRKEFIGIVAQHFFHELSHLSASRLLTLAQNLANGIPRGDIQVNFSNPHLQNILASVGADGRMSTTTSDYLSIIDSNLSYNKINPYVHESATYHVVIQPDRWLDADLTIRYTDQPAPAYIYANSYGPGAGKTGKPSDYADFIRVFVPAGSQLSSQSGWQGWMPSSAYGKTMFSGYLIVRKGQTRTVHLRYVIPPNVFSWSNGSSYRLLWQHQAGSHPDRIGISVVTVAGPSFSTVVSHPDSDWTHTISIPALPFRPLSLPPIPAPVVANGHWVEPYAYLARR